MTSSHARKFANHRELIFDQLDHRSRYAKRIGSDGVTKPLSASLSDLFRRGLRFSVRKSDGALLGTYADEGPITEPLTAEMLRRRFLDNDLGAQFGMTPTVEQFAAAFDLLTRSVRAEHEELTVRESALAERRLAELEARRDETAARRARLAELRAEVDAELGQLDTEPTASEAPGRRGWRRMS